MEASEVSAKLREWSREFADIAGSPIDVPDRLWDFLVDRMAESDIIAASSDVVRMKIDNRYMKVRLTGKRGRHLIYEPVDGSLGFGMLEMRMIHPEDRGIATAVIEQMLADGRITA